jgi:hypothetical protein
MKSKGRLHRVENICLSGLTKALPLFVLEKFFGEIGFDLGFDLYYN